jgi:hypothetical protein
LRSRYIEVVICELCDVSSAVSCSRNTPNCRATDIGEHNIEFALFPFDLCKGRSRSPRFDTSPCTLVTFLRISLTAATDSVSRRTVMKTYAPSFTEAYVKQSQSILKRVQSKTATRRRSGYPAPKPTRIAKNQTWSTGWMRALQTRPRTIEPGVVSLQLNHRLGT